MIDLHIINHVSSTTPEWWEKCLASAQKAESLGYIKLYIVDGITNNIGKSRVDGFKQGDSEYVAYLDNDDILIPEAIPFMTEVLDKYTELCGVYSDRMQIDADDNVLFTMMRSNWSYDFQLKSGDFPHMLSIYRRVAVMPYLDIISTFKTYSEFVLTGLVTRYGPWKHVPVIAYKRRENQYYVNHVRVIDSEQVERARNIVLPILMARR